MFPNSLPVLRDQFRHISYRILKHISYRTLAMCLDCTGFALSGFLAFELRFDGELPAMYLYPMSVSLGIWVIAKLVAFLVAKLDRGSWRYTSASDAIRIVFANSIGSALGGLTIFLLLGPWGIPRSVYVLDWLLCCMLTLGGRLIVRAFRTTGNSHRASSARTRTLIYGAGAAGVALLWELCQNHNLQYEVVGLIDDDPSKGHLILRGKRILGNGESLAAVARKYGVKRILIAIPSATGPQMVRILKYALDAGVEYRTVPGLGDLIESEELGKQIREVAVEDLLGRNPVQLDQERIRKCLEGKVVMVTGAAGSIGSELCRQIAHFHPLALIGFDAAETPLFQLNREMARSFPWLDFHPEIGNITRPDTLRLVLQRYRPTILYHAAAYKHVPMMEKHVFSAVENNIFGTWQVALAAAQNGVDDFVMISTDKAVRPTSMMGATKRVAELVIRALHEDAGTKFVAVRFGNVLGSNGSVVPIFKEQIAAGGPVTVTHPEMTRYFMTIPEAAQLVLQAFSIGKGGEVFVLDMGDPVKIVDLARNLILLSGLKPDREIKIEYSGLRPGEKLYEELNLRDEQLVPTAHSKIASFISPFCHDLRHMRLRLRELQRIVDTQDVGRLILLLKELVPDYNPDSQLLKVALSSAAASCEHAELEIPSGHKTKRSDSSFPDEVCV